MPSFGVLSLFTLVAVVAPIGDTDNPTSIEIRQALDSGDVDGALSKAQQWVAAEPNLARAHLCLGVCWERRGDGKADREFEQALELAPQDADLALEIADVYATRFADVLQSDIPDGAPAERARAEELYAKTAQLQGNSMTSLPRIAWLKKTAGDVAGAKAVLFAAIAIDPMIDAPHYDLWNLLGSGVEYDELASFYDGLAAGSYAPAALARCRSFQGQIFCNKALAYRAQANASAAAADTTASAVALEAARNAYVAALPCFDRAAAADPSTAAQALAEKVNAFVGIVTILGERRDFEAARLTAEDAQHTLDPLLRATPSDSQLQLDVDNVAYALFVAAGGEANRDDAYVGRMSAIFETWTWATAIVQDRADWWNNLGFFAREAARYEDSYAAYRKCIELAPDSVRYQNDTALILVYHLHRDLDEAGRMLDKAVALGAEQYPKVKDDPTAEADLRSAWGDAMLNQGKLLTELDRFDDAAAAFDRLAALDPERGDWARERETLDMKRKLAAALDAGNFDTVRSVVEADLAGEAFMRRKHGAGRDDDARVVALMRWALKRKPDVAALAELLAHCTEVIAEADAERAAAHANGVGS